MGQDQDGWGVERQIDPGSICIVFDSQGQERAIVGAENTTTTETIGGFVYTVVIEHWFHFDPWLLNANSGPLTMQYRSPQQLFGTVDVVVANLKNYARVRNNNTEAGIRYDLTTSRRRVL